MRLAPVDTYYLYVRVCITVDTERYMCMMPIMNTMLDKCEHMLNVSAYLPNIPHSDANPSFCDDFSSYLQSNEWKMFMKKQASGTSVMLFVFDCHIVSY